MGSLDAGARDDPGANLGRATTVRFGPNDAMEFKVKSETEHRRCLTGTPGWDSRRHRDDAHRYEHDRK
jgi:hypothetical protein